MAVETATTSENPSSSNYHAKCARERLVREIDVLLRCQEQFGHPAYPIMEQLVADEGREQMRLTTPPIPAPMNFHWPKSGVVTSSADRSRRR